jgi:hypothetical protein
VELFNRGGLAVDLAGWALDDIAAVGRRPHVLPADASLAPGGLLVIFCTQSRVWFNNDADSVRLLSLDNAEIDHVTHADRRPDGSCRRAPDGEGSSTWRRYCNSQHSPIFRWAFEIAVNLSAWPIHLP